MIPSQESRTGSGGNCQNSSANRNGGTTPSAESLPRSIVHDVRASRSERLRQNAILAAAPSLASRYRPQLATLVKKPPDGDTWLHELKLDRYRRAHRDACLASREDMDNRVSADHCGRA